MSTTPERTDAPLRATIGGGSIYLPRELCERYLPHATAVALLARDGALLIVPLDPGSAGGLLLKVRNARADRVIHAHEFFRSHGFAEDIARREVAIRWDADRSALVLELPLGSPA
jgi:hypothetical protein